MYIKKYPDDKKYISIFKENTENGEKKKKEIKQEIINQVDFWKLLILFKVNKKLERKLKYEEQSEAKEKVDDFFV